MGSSNLAPARTPRASLAVHPAASWGAVLSPFSPISRAPASPRAALRADQNPGKRPSSCARPRLSLFLPVLRRRATAPERRGLAFCQGIN